MHRPAWIFSLHPHDPYTADSQRSSVFICESSVFSRQFLMATIQVGSQFESFISLENAVKEYEKEQNVIFYKREARTINSMKRRVLRLNFENAENLRYYYIKYSCIFGGRKHKKRSTTGTRQSKSLKQQGCSAFINVLLSADATTLNIVAMNTDHNHTISCELYKKLPKLRRLGEEEQQKINKLMRLQVNRKLLKQQIIQETGKQITMKDLSNIAAKFNKQGVKSSNQVPIIQSESSIVPEPQLLICSTSYEQTGQQISVPSTYMSSSQPLTTSSCTNISMSSDHNVLITENTPILEEDDENSFHDHTGTQKNENSEVWKRKSSEEIDTENKVMGQTQDDIKNCLVSLKSMKEKELQYQDKILSTLSGLLTNQEKLFDKLDELVKEQRNTNALLQVIGGIRLVSE